MEPELQLHLRRRALQPAGKHPLQLHAALVYKRLIDSTRYQNKQDENAHITRSEQRVQPGLRCHSELPYAETQLCTDTDTRHIEKYLQTSKKHHKQFEIAYTKTTHNKCGQSPLTVTNIPISVRNSH